MRFAPPKMRPTLLALAVATALAGCGGGGGSGDEASVDRNASPGQIVEGRAVKGTLKHADVKVYALSTLGERGTLLWQGKTDSTGAFKAHIGNHDGEYEIVVSAVPGTTTMTCDVPAGCGSAAFGEDMNVAAAFEISALARSGTAAQDVAVTPWTAMAAARARQLVKGGTPLSEAVETARSETSAILGFDIAVTPADLTDGDLGADEQARYAVANAALAELLLKNNEVAQNLSDLVTSFQDGMFDENDPVRIGDIKQHLEAVLRSSQAGSKLADKRTEMELIAAALPEDTFDPKPAETMSGSEIEQFRTFVQQVRTWLTQVEQTDFVTPLEALQIDQVALNATFNTQTAGMMDELSGILAQIEDYLKAHAEEIRDKALTGQTIVLPVTRVRETASGPEVVTVGNLNLNLGLESDRVTVSAHAQGLNLGDDAPRLDIKRLFVRTPLTLTQALQSASGDVVIPVGEHVLDVEAELATDQGLSVVLSRGHATLTLRKALTVPTLPLPDSAPLKDAFKLAAYETEAEIRDGQGHTFKGTWAAEGVRLDVESVNQVNLSRVAWSGTFTGSRGSQELEISLRLNNASVFDWQGMEVYDGTRFIYQRLPANELTGEDFLQLSRDYLPDQPGEVYRVAGIQGWVGEDAYTVFAEAGAVQQAEDKSVMTQCLVNHISDAGYPETWWCDDGTKLTETWMPYPRPDYQNAAVIEEIRALLRRYNTVKVNGETLVPEADFYSARVNSLDNHLYIQGELHYPGLEETDSHFADVTVTLKARAALPDLPEATVTVVANRARLDGGNAAVKVDWGEGSYTALLDIRDTQTEQPSAEVTFFNANGMKLVVTSPNVEEDVIDIAGEAFVRGKKVGDLSTSEGHYILRYTDGSFETLY